MHCYTPLRYKCSTQPMISTYKLNVSNSVKQGGIFSPRLFAVYVDDLSKHFLHNTNLLWTL